MPWEARERQVDQDSDISEDPKIRELLREAKSADRQDQERAELFGAMIRSAAWHQYVEILNAKLQGMADELIKPSKSVDELVALEYVKGTMSGLILARDLPSVTIAAMEQLRRDRRAQPAEEEIEDE
jgi:hypothetical protein